MGTCVKTSTRGRRAYLERGCYRLELFHKRSSLQDSVGALCGDAALVALVANHLDVALHAPTPTPAVPHDPVIFPVGRRAVSDHRHAVVEVVDAVLAPGVVVDTAEVQLEPERRGIDADGDDRLLKGRRFERDLVAAGDVLVAAERGGDLGLVELAAAAGRPLVRVVRLRLDPAARGDVLDALVGGVVAESWGAGRSMGSEGGGVVNKREKER